MVTFKNIKKSVIVFRQITIQRKKRNRQVFYGNTIRMERL